MFIMFKENGCKNCPFLDEGDYAHIEISCNISKYTNIIKEIKADWNKKPDNCPFKNNEQIEVIAEVTE